MKKKDCLDPHKYKYVVCTVKCYTDHIYITNILSIHSTSEHIINTAGLGMKRLAILDCCRHTHVHTHAQAHIDTHTHTADFLPLHRKQHYTGSACHTRASKKLCWNGDLMSMYVIWHMRGVSRGSLFDLYSTVKTSTCAWMLHLKNDWLLKTN